MKYIRTTTPTNIYSLEQTFIVDRTDVTCFKTHGNKGRYVNDTIETEENLEKWLKYNKTSILKQADTIEELCDGFIIGKTLKIYNKSNFNFERKIVNLGHKEYCKFENLKSIYGVIMTFTNDIPRIITVAKMNEEGVLCLI